MKKINKLVVVTGILIIACDADLFKTEDEVLPPTVSEISSSAAEFILNVGDTAEFWINASDPDGKDLTYKWTKNGGIFLSTSDRSMVNWRAPFQGGDYEISVRVSNGDKEASRSRIVRVISSEKPVVRIIKPAEDEFMVQFQTYNLQVEAFHDNGISLIKFFVNQEFKATMIAESENIYTYSWIVDSPAGKSELKIVAESNAVGTANEEKRQVYIEGVVPGKH